MKKNICIFCNSKTKNVKHNLPSFTHFGYEKISNKIFFKKCLKCQLIFNPKKILSNFFKNKKYAKENIDYIIKKEKNRTISKKSFISKIIIRLFKKKTGLKILEIGCSNGLIMRKLDRKFYNSKFFGTEINNYYKKEFPKKNNFKLLINPDLEKFKKKSFDLIIMSHVFNYFNNPQKVLLQLHHLLKMEGNLFFVLPNITKNPYYSLMGDQKLILTTNSLTNILKISGFTAKIIRDQNLSRELILVASKKKLKKFNLKKDTVLEKNIKIIKKKRNKILKQKIKIPIVFGTSINSACIDEFVESKTSFFVDEYVNKFVKKFRDKKIIHPKKLRKNNQVIFSLHKNNKLKKKLQYKYHAKFISF